MFSQFSSFLPEVLQPKDAKQPQQHPPPPTQSPDTDAETDIVGPSNMGTDELGVRKKEKRSNEAFIIVRPPPSKTNHPLNLQVQLVPPNASKDRGRRMSIDSSADDGTLSRTTSRTDTNSIYSSYSSAGSVASVGSTSTASSGRRMIIPLYNLQAHNVLTNIVADAGTDAKIAKFHKRGMEVIGLAVLEPTEVYGAGGHPTLEAHLQPLVAVQTNSSRAVSPEPGQRSLTPSSSHYSLSSSSAGQHHPQHPLHQAPAEQPQSPASATPPPASGAKKLFGRFFKKKDSPASSTPASPAEPSTPTRRSFLPTSSAAARPVSMVSVNAPMPNKRSSLLLAPQPTGPTEPAPMLMPAVLGVQPALSASTYPPHGRPGTYTWTVRRWLKGPAANEGLLGVVSSMNVLGAALPGMGGGSQPVSIEVRFEWTRGAKKGSSPTSATANRMRKRSQATGDRPLTAAAADSNGASTASLVSDAPHVRSGTRRSGEHRRPRSNSPGTGLRRAQTSSTDAHSIATGSEDPHALDDGDESDPEDSETPWACALVARRAGGSPGAPDAVRVKVATLSPTPHHPKVVAALTVPFPLPDIDVEMLNVRKRVVTPAGIARPAPSLEKTESGASSASAGGAGGAPRKEGLVLTAEEIKDIVSATAMWLVVREGIGGVGRVTRKGDGWRLRS